MKRAISGWLVGMAVGLAASGAASSAQRTFVSGSGDDANPCTRTQPCRSFAKAIGLADAGGEVVALDTAGYGGFSVTKAISIISPPGILAAITSPVAVPGPLGGNAAVTVDAGPNDRVVLRGLNVNITGGTFVTGVAIQSAGVVHIENSALGNGNLASPGSGIVLYPGANPVKVFVKDTVIRGFDNAVWLRGLNARGILTADRMRIHDNNNGVVVTYNASAVMRDVTSSGNANAGFSVYSNNSGTPATLMLERCTASQNAGSGVEVGPAVGGGIAPTAQVAISNCTITNNKVGTSGAVLNPIPQGTGWVISRGNNTIRDNMTNVVGGLGSISPL